MHKQTKEKYLQYLRYAHDCLRGQLIENKELIELQFAINALIGLLHERKQYTEITIKRCK